MKTGTGLSMLSGLALSLALCDSLHAQGPEVGDKAPEINAKEWVNTIGSAPDLKSLRGQTVLLEFWATWCVPCRGAWPHLKEVYEEFSGDGLYVIALSDEPAKLVGPYVDKFDLPFNVAAGSTANAAYGVDSIPHTFLIAPDGKIAWHGHPSELSKSVIKSALKGSKRPKGGFLALRPQAEDGAKLSRAEKLAADGELAAALKDVDTVIGDPKSLPEDQARATSTKEQLTKHVDGLFKAAETLVTGREIARALTVLDALASEFSSGEFGQLAKTRRDAIAADPKLMSEIEAGKELDKVKESIRSLGLGKSRSKLEALVKKYPSTKAAERAKVLLAS